MSTVMTSSVILDGGLPAHQCLPGILHLWITVLISSTVISKMPLSSVLFCVYGIVTGNENISPSDVLGAFLDICVTIVSSLN